MTDETFVVAELPRPCNACALAAVKAAAVCQKPTLVAHCPHHAGGVTMVGYLWAGGRGIRGWELHAPSSAESADRMRATLDLALSPSASAVPQ